MNKTVYVLGAGFSVSAGAPMQYEIIKEILLLRKLYPSVTNPAVNQWLDKFENFLRTDLGIDDADRNEYSLEDIYTPIDKAIIESSSFRSYTPQRLIILKESINKLVKLAVRETIDRRKWNQDYLQKFANYIVELSKEKAVDRSKDNVAVITTNWDILLDNKVWEIAKAQSPSGVVDYCCYTNPRDQSDDDTIKPGLFALGEGNFNVKILKLHGSLNWLQCPKCQRLYIKLYSSFPGGNVTSYYYCRNCKENFKQGNKDRDIRLVSNMIMPTFIKDLSNVQNKLVWQNTGIELSEASKIVFIGYSLPYADFEFRQLMSKMIRLDAEIEVIDFGSSATADNIVSATTRFKTFFGNRFKGPIYHEGAKKYIEDKL